MKFIILAPSGGPCIYIYIYILVWTHAYLLPMHIHAQCVVEQSQVFPMSVEPISVFFKQLLRTCLCMPRSESRDVGRAGQSSAEGWAWQVLQGKEEHSPLATQDAGLGSVT